MKIKFLLLLLIPAFVPVSGLPLYSPTWGFSMDLPGGYEFFDGDGRDRFSFMGPGKTQFDIRVYNSTYESVKSLVDDVNRRLGNRGSVDFFDYHNKPSAIIELKFGNIAGWGLCVTLDGESGPLPMLLALSYGPAASQSPLDLFHMSALDSIVPSPAEKRYPGPIMEYSFPRGEPERGPIAMSGINALIRKNDAEAAQVLVEREYQLLQIYAASPGWQEAWIRYYRAIYRDSWDRIADALFQLERGWNVNADSKAASNGDAEMALAKKALTWVQGFDYERDTTKSDFVNLVSAITEGRGDCDSRAMLWAMILAQADIRAAMMVSQKHSHAMGLADISGQGARFEAEGINWLVAETTANVDIGLIAQDVSDTESWLGVIFE